MENSIFSAVCKAVVIMALLVLSSIGILCIGDGWAYSQKELVARGYADFVRMTDGTNGFKWRECK